MKRFWVWGSIVLGVVANSTLCALTEMPWFQTPLEFVGRLVVNPSFFTNVKNGYNPTHYHSTNVLAEAALLVPILPTVDVEAEITLLRTSKYPFGFESVALQGRMLFLDDLSGDPISLDVGFNIRIVAAQRLHDVATPYHNLANFELTSAIGKEWQWRENWLARSYLVLGLGEANKGYPWTRFYLRGEVELVSQLALNAFLAGYFGLGPRNNVNVSHFSSYALIQHQNVDIGAGLSYFFKVYGELSFMYAYRLFAHAFPDKYQSFRLSYSIPFSL